MSSDSSHDESHITAKLSTTEHGEDGHDHSSTCESIAKVRHRKRKGATELDPEKLKAFEETDRRRGVVYVSRIPPFLKPIKLRHMLEQFAKIGRVYLAPEG